MILCKDTKKAKFYDAVTKIPEKVWQELGCTDNLYFNPKYLKAIAKEHSEIQYVYLVLNDENENPVAFATLHIINFHLSSVKNNMEFVINKVKFAVKKLGILNLEKTFKILLCGNPFVSGEHGIFIKNNQNKKELIKQIAKAVDKYVNSKKEYKNEVNVSILKDFEGESLEITNKLHQYSFNSFSVEPNMILNLNPDWQSFEDYLASLKTKFRVKAKKAFSLSNSLKTVAISSENIERFLPNMKDLYKNVSTSSTFNLVDFNLNSYKILKEQLKENYILQAYFLNEKLVGFLSGMINKNSLDAHFVGIDYNLNRKYAIYQRMLYDYITLAIERKLQIINFGRTASEIKSSIGATPKNLTIYLRHKKSLQNTVIKPFLKRIKPTPFRQSKPFKIQYLEEKV